VPLARILRISPRAQLAIDPSLYPQIQGGADTEFLFFLALTLGLTDGPPAASRRPSA
jgi:glutamine amidotransferase